MEIVKQKKVLNKALLALRSGKVIICPTDTIYGFLADATDKKAVEKIFKIKKRPRSKPLPVFVKDIKMAKELAEINKNQENVLKKFWPGKYTFILKSKVVKNLSKLVIGGDNTIALRVPKHKFLNNLLKKINKPLSQTSVNISGRPALTKITDIISQFGGSDIPMLIVDAGDLLKNKPSAIIDLTKDKIKTLRKQYGKVKKTRS